MGAAQSRQPWAYLSDDVLYEIVRRIPCEVDRLRMSRVCHSWRVALKKIKPPAPAPPPPLPWLLLPEDDEHGLTFSCVLSECRTHPFFLPHAARRARYFGSCDGAWLFLAVDGQGAQAQDHVLVNLNNFQYLDLPNAILLSDWDEPSEVQDLKKISIVAATLSRPPTEQGCVVAGIIDLPLAPRRVVFWRMGDRVVSPVYADVWPPEEVEDLLYYKGKGSDDEAFLLLTQDEDIHVCEPRFHGSDVQVHSSLLRFTPRGADGQPVLARYLVESRGEILMVVRFGSPLQHEPAASEFRVFKGTRVKHGKFKINLWNSMSELDGRMLFIGRGCSRSYEAADRYPGMEEGVYFLDDRSFHDPNMAFSDRAYLCRDNGEWSEAPDPLVKRCFPGRGLSDNSPPVWILP